MAWSEDVVTAVFGALSDLVEVPGTPEPGPEELWAASGAMELTGDADGPPLPAPGDPAGVAQLLLDVWAERSATRTGRRPSSPGVGLLGERAALAGLGRQGGISCGGAARLLPTATRPFVLSLARSEDVELVPALIGGRSDGDPWAAVARWLRGVEATEADERAQLLGLPGAMVPAVPPVASRPAVVATVGPTHMSRRDRPRVLDLSSLWAGPLCAHLLGLAGADVVKLESTRRPDGARHGTEAFFNLLHGGHRTVAIDFDDRDDRAMLARLVMSVDVVLESSRPRALAQLGIEAADAVSHGVTWVSITAQGRDVDCGSRVGFGDDVAASSGLISQGSQGPVFCGDAIADPLAGLAAAAACSAALASDRAWLLDVSMRDISRIAASAYRPGRSRGRTLVEAPSVRTPTVVAAAMGRHRDEVLREWLA